MSMGRTSFAFAAALLALTAACSGSTTSSGSGLSASSFIGTWKATSGTITLNCGGQTSTSTITGDVVWAAGTNGGIVQTGSCNLTATISGSTASASNESCTEMDSTTGGTIQLQLTSYTFAVSADDKTATENGSGSASETISGQSVTCTYSETASYQKIAN